MAGFRGGFNPEVRESVAKEDLIRSFGVETFPGERSCSIPAGRLRENVFRTCSYYEIKKIPSLFLSRTSKHEGNQ